MRPAHGRSCRRDSLRSSSGRDSRLSPGLEDADYRGHSLSMLQRIARALNKRLDVRFVQAGPRQRVRAA